MFIAPGFGVIEFILGHGSFFLIRSPFNLAHLAPVSEEKHLLFISFTSLVVVTARGVVLN